MKTTQYILVFYVLFVLMRMIAELIDYQGYRHSRLLPYMLTCPIPKDYWYEVLRGVSLVQYQCSLASNLLKVGQRSFFYIFQKMNISLNGFLYAESLKNTNLDYQLLLGCWCKERRFFRRIYEISNGVCI